LNPSPFGRYSEILATGVAVVSILAAIVAHVLTLHPDSFLDNLALLAFGAVFAGQASKNGAALIAVQAHRRLDLINAPRVESNGTVAAPAPAGGAPG
jgi:hypothetical protein